MFLLCSMVYLGEILEIIGSFFIQMTNKAKLKYVHMPVRMEVEGMEKAFSAHLLFPRHPCLNALITGEQRRRQN